MITLNTISSYDRPNRKRVGRGHGSGLGTTAGRGTKGQRARTGGRKRVARRSLKSLIERLPKVRGSSIQESRSPIPVSLKALQERFATGTIVTPESARAQHLIKRGDALNIVGGGELTNKLTIYAHKFSKTAKVAIIKAGGAPITLPKPLTRKVLATRRQNAQV